MCVDQRELAVVSFVHATFVLSVCHSTIPVFSLVLAPGAMQSVNWEQDDAGRGCFNPNSDACYQGNVPVYAVQVRQPSDVTNAIIFANR